MGSYLFLPRTVGCLTGQNKNRPLHSGPYTEDFDFAIVDTPMHHALMHKSNFWSKIKSDLKPLEEHCVGCPSVDPSYKAGGLPYTAKKE